MTATIRQRLLFDENKAITPNNIDAINKSISSFFINIISSNQRSIFRYKFSREDASMLMS